MNLLPRERKSAVRRLYLIRLVVIALLLVSGVALVHAMLYVPSYLFVHEVERSRTLELASLGQELSGSEEKQVNARVKVLNESAQYLAKTTTGPSGSTAIRLITMVPHPGVSVHGISYMRSTGGPRMTLTGIASSREALRGYAASLGQLPYISKVNLPIAAYAKETDIDFTVTLEGSFMP